MRRKPSGAETERYVLGRRLASGGMADIYLARQGTSGFDRSVVVKQLSPRWHAEPRVVEMFRGEARIGALLNHPNIVHLYDFGEHAGVPYIAMEYVDGEELSTLCQRGLELGRFLPLEHAVDLVRQAAEGMAYFHARRDADGEPLAIVHRDISPSNLLVTVDGNLKIIDFGIARSRLSSPDDGLIPGKQNYMSPEQVRGEPVDHRSDIFSLGIVLYEVTVGKRLFKGAPELVIQKITKERVPPPTFVRRTFPPTLERIVMRALEPRPEDRYQTAYELARDLESYLRDDGLRSGPLWIARYLDDLRAAAGGERREEFEVWRDEDRASTEEPLDFDRFPAPAPAPAAGTAPAPAADAAPAPAADAAPAPAPDPAFSIGEGILSRSRPPPILLLVVVGTVLALLAVALFQ